MSEKVIVPKHIADALKLVIKEEEERDAWAFFNIVRCGKDQLDEHAAIIKEYFNGVRMLDLARVFINGYEVHLTPEERVREIYERHNGGVKGSISWETQAEIEEIVTILGHKIRGVNA